MIPKKPILTSLLSLLIGCSAPYQQDTKNYLCHVQTTQVKKQIIPQNSPDTTKPKERIVEVYFPLGSDKLSSEESAKIIEFVYSIDNNASVSVEGYADYRGSAQLNYTLSKNRIQGVESILETNGTFNVRKAVFGERKAVKNTDDPWQLQLDRKVRLISPARPVKQGLDYLIAGTYLIDQSSSMNEGLEKGTKWSEVQDYHFPKESNIYTFTNRRRECNHNLSQEKPQGRTPLFLSLYELLKKTAWGTPVTILTDGEDNFGGKTAEEIILLANQKGIQISFMGLGLYNHINTFEKITTETSGKLYLTD